MGRGTRPSEQRLATILKRQDPPGWGPDYIPGQLATRDEAPPASRPCTFRAAAFGRDLHAMSDPEKHAMLLGMHLGRPIELNEGRMLVREPCAIRLSQHPKAAALPAVRLRGTVQVAEALGALDSHPRVSVSDPSRARGRLTVPYPLLGDLLWIFEDDQGPYPLNWTVKGRPEDFERPAFRRSSRRAGTRAEELAVQARQAIEETYYRDGNVPTVRVTGVDIPPPVVNNLRQVYLWHDRTTCLRGDRRKELVELLRAHMTMQIPPFETLRDGAATEGWEMRNGVAVLFQAIWRRELRVDLWEPININWPLRPEEKDPRAHFAAWFARGAR